MLHIGTRCSLAHAQSDDHTAASGAFHRRPNPAGLPRVAIPAATFILNLHSSACRTAAVVQSAVSSLAGFRTPAPCLCLDLYGPASENLHKSRHYATQQKSTLFDHLVGAGEERRRHCQVKRVFVVFRLTTNSNLAGWFEREFPRLHTRLNLVHVGRGTVACSRHKP